MGDIVIPPVSSRDTTPPDSSLQLTEDRIQGLLDGTPSPEPSDDAPAKDADAEDIKPSQDEDDDLTELLDEEAEEAPDPATETTYTVKIDGKEEKVTLDEALKGYSRQADYTRKTQALAEENKKLAAEMEETRKAREEYAARLDAVQKHLDAITPKEPDWDALRGKLSTEEFNAAVAEWQIGERRREKLVAEQERVNRELMQDQQRQMAQVVQEQQKVLHEALPDLADPTKAEAYAAKIIEYAISQGIAREAVEREVFATPLIVLDKARRYDALVARKASMTTKAKKAPTATPGPKRTLETSERKQRQAARDLLRKTGRVQDAIPAIEGILAGQ